MSDYVPFDEQFEQERASGRSEGASQERTRQRSSQSSRDTAKRRASSAAQSTRQAAQGASVGLSVDKVQARKMVLVSAFLLVVIAVYRDRKQGTSDVFRALWGVGVVSMLLAILADFAPVVAGPFAALTVLGSLTSGGTSIIDRILGTVSKSTGGTSGTTGVPKSTTSTGSAAAETAASPGRASQ